MSPGDTGAAVSERSCLKNTKLHFPHNTKSRQITQLVSGLTTVYVYARVTGNKCTQNMQTGNMLTVE